MYIFKEFNVRHKRQLMVSGWSYAVVFAGAVIGMVLAGQSTTRLVSGTLIALLVAHIVRIYQLSFLADLKMTAIEKWWLVAGAAFGVLSVVFALANASNAQVLDLSNHRRILFPITLAIMCSIHIDFFLARMVARFLHPARIPEGRDA